MMTKEQLAASLNLTVEQLNQRLLQIAAVMQTSSAAQPSVSKPTHVAAKPQRSYYFVRSGEFATIVDGRDATSEAEAITVAKADRLQPWYVVRDRVSSIDNVTLLDHNKYVDWLRRS